jgi:hypothetical protein
MHQNLNRMEETMRSSERTDVAKIQRQLRILQGYAAVSALGFAIVLLAALKPADQKAKFSEIEVGRINIVEPNGKLRLTISNNAQSPGLEIGGKYYSAREGTRGAGFTFYNDEGDEDGGLAYHGKTEDGKTTAGGLFAFDQYGQDQIVGITYHQSQTRRVAGLQVWDRPEIPLAGIVAKVDTIEKMKDGAEKTEAMTKLQQEAVANGLTGATRVFVGRDDQDNATVILSDTKSKPRIIMSVDTSGAAALKFLDENGKVVDTLPHSAEENKKP